MNRYHFSLKPFTEGDVLPEYNLSGTIGRTSDILAVRFEAKGKLADLVIPAQAATPLRKDNLWQQTCFELFVAKSNSPKYWEFNLSAAGHWNIYAFSSYRQDMQKEAALQALPFALSRESDMVALDLEVNLEMLIPSQEKINVAICAVVEQRSEGLSYWALTHCGTKPDFHLRDSFIMTF